MLVTSRDPAGVQMIVTSSSSNGGQQQEEDDDYSHFDAGKILHYGDCKYLFWFISFIISLTNMFLCNVTAAANLRRFFDAHDNRQGIAVLGFQVSSVNDLYQRYLDKHPHLVLQKRDYKEAKVLEVYSFYKGDTSDSAKLIEWTRMGVASSRTNSLLVVKLMAMYKFPDRNRETLGFVEDLMGTQRLTTAVKQDLFFQTKAVYIRAALGDNKIPPIALDDNWMKKAMQVFMSNSFGQLNYSYLMGASNFFNHSCIPNVELKTGSDNITAIMALREIPKGEQAFISCVRDDTPKSDRRTILEATYGFRCECELCVRHDKYPHCEQCDQKATKRCTRCKCAMYCSRECQRANWKMHMGYCTKIATANQAAGLSGVKH